MKTLFITLAFTLITMLNFAQSSEHLTFKGVPIDGTLNEFITKMTLNGFTNSGTENGKAILNGDFAGYKDCVINVSTLKQKDLVNNIGVLFTKKDTWSTLSDNFFEFKLLITEKYGKPNEVEEKFESYSQPNDDNRKMYEVLFNRCKYFSIWQTDKGKIQLSIENNQGSSRVKLTYLDKINSDIIKAKAKDDL
jgi:hypothetical protein